MRPEDAPAFEPQAVDIEVARLWQIGVVAKEWGLSPARAAWELDNDPQQLALVLLPLLRYSEAFEVWKRADADELKGWRNVPMMKRVEEIGMEFAEADIRAEREE